MATSTIKYRGLSGVRGTVTVEIGPSPVANTLTEITNLIIADEGLNANYYADFFLLRDNSVKLTANGADDWNDLSLASTDELVAVLDDDPATFTKQQRQVRKLEIAAIKRAADGRPSTYDINKLPNPYNNDSASPDDGATTLVAGRPWS